MANFQGLRDMEYRQNLVGFDIELYFVNDPSLRITVEARSLNALRKKLEPLELAPKLSSIYGAAAPEFQRATKPRTARQSSRRLDMAEIPSRQRRSR
jgi:hypothetical protein